VSLDAALAPALGSRACPPLPTTTEDAFLLPPWPSLSSAPPPPRPRAIPVLLLAHEGLVKTTRFSGPKYVGDPLNAVRIFNEKEVDEIVLLDIEATPQERSPRFDLIAEIAQECFMPLAYGGGVRTLGDIERLVSIGVEKVALNSALFEAPGLLAEAARQFGSSTLVASIDVRHQILGGLSVWTHGGRRNTRQSPASVARRLESEGAGELLLNSIDRDGTMKGYDLDLVRSVSGSVGLPVIACGGAGSVSDLLGVLDAKASAAAAGSLFVFHGKHRAVLISYPDANALRRS
jgi:imidazole glycerol-phosphate synthase subunit HisF